MRRWTLLFLIARDEPTKLLGKSGMPETLLQRYPASLIEGLLTIIFSQTREI